MIQAEFQDQEFTDIKYLSDILELLSKKDTLTSPKRNLTIWRSLIIPRYSLKFSSDSLEKVCIDIEHQLFHHEIFPEKTFQITLSLLNHSENKRAKFVSSLLRG